MASGSIPRIPIQVSRDCVVASIQIDLSEDVLRQFRADFLEMIRESEASNVILDVSGVEVIDGEDFQAIRNTMPVLEVRPRRVLTRTELLHVVSGPK